MASNSVGELFISLSLEDKKFASSLSKVKSSNTKTADDVKKAWDKASALSAAVVSRAFNKIADTISSSIGSAIKRVDTLNNFPKVMESLGYGSEEASGSINVLKNSIDGLPTSLDDIVGNVQTLSATMGNLNKGTVNATSVGVAFNNMMLAGGQGTQAAQNALTQYNQMLAVGKVDQAAWNSVVSAAPGQLNQVAQTLLGADKNQKDLYEAMKEGTVTFDDFNKAIVDLNAQGGEGFASFEEQARSATGGIGTALENVQNRAAKAVGSVIESLDATGIASSINNFSSQFGVLGDIIAGVLNGEDVSAKMSEFTSGMGSALSGGIIQILSSASTMIPTIVEAVLSLIPAIIEGLTQSAPALLDGAIQLLMVILDALPTIIDSLVTALPQIVDTLVNTLTSPTFLQQLLQATITLFLALVRAIPQVITTLINALPTIIENIISFLTNPSTIQMLLEAGVELFMALVQSIPQVAGAIFNAIGSILNSVFGRIGSFFGQILGAVGEWLGSLFAPIGEFFGNIFAKVGEFIGFIGGIMAQIFNIVTTPIRMIWQVISGIFIAIVAVLATAGQWVYETVLQPIFNFVGFIIGSIVNAITGFISTAQAVIGTIVGWVDANVIQPIAGFFSMLWSGIEAGIQGVVNFFSGAFSAISSFVGGVVNGIKGFFEGLWNGIKAGVDAVKSVISNVFSTISGIIKAPINGIIGAINGVIGTINGITVPDWVPVIGGAHANIPTIPTLAQGGYAGSATPAIFGEAGAEVALPLERNTDNWSGLLAAALAEEFDEMPNGTANKAVQITQYNDFDQDMTPEQIEEIMARSIRMANV